MKKRKNQLAMLLGFGLCIGTTACASNGSSEETLTAETTEMQYSSEDIANIEYDESLMLTGYQNFSMQLFGECSSAANAEENVMISPTSVMMALEMVDAGANGATEEQITQMLCPGAQNEELQAYTKDYAEQLQESEDVTMHIANSVWINQATLASQINNDYVEYLEDNFGALAKAVPFDNDTVEEMNEWVMDNTDNMIDKIVDRLSEDAALMLINAISFEAKWEEPYEEYQIDDGEFTNADGTTADVTMLNGSSKAYYESDDATGFIQYYAGGEYAFVAILPKEEGSANEYAANMTAQSYNEFMESVSYDYDVETQMPEFKSEYEIVMNDILCNQFGMRDAFDPEKADFTNIAMLDEGNLYISTVLHKTYIELDRNGTRAAAVTAIQLDSCSADMPREIKSVILDRPFVYAIIHTSNNQPVFIGTMNTIAE